MVLSPEPEPEALSPIVPPAPEKTPAHAASQALASDQFLADLANEIDQLGIDQLTPSFSEPSKDHAPVAALKSEVAPAPGEHEPLKEVFDEFRAELGEMGAEDEDLETHYNLGIAFREMGLLEEAISEFQKVATAQRTKGRHFVTPCNAARCWAGIYGEGTALHRRDLVRTRIEDSGRRPGKYAGVAV